MPQTKENFLNSREASITIFDQMNMKDLKDSDLNDTHLHLFLCYIRFISRVTYSAATLRIFTTEKIQSYITQNIDKQLFENKYIIFSKPEDYVKCNTNDVFIFILYEQNDAMKEIVKKKMLQEINHILYTVHKKDKEPLTLS